MSHAKNKIKWCLDKAEKELKEKKKHRGLIKEEIDLEKARKHIAKAEHNLKTTFYLQKGGFTDWCSSTLFYTIYHCFLAILAKYGYESRNQECTFVFICSLIEDGKINITEEEMEKISNLDVEGKQQSEYSAINIREEYQYTTKVSLGEKDFNELLSLAKEILYKTKLTIEE